MAGSEDDVDIAQLSPEQQEALQTYTSVTDQDVKDAVSLLQRSEWNVQIAITKFFDGESADPLEAARQEAAVPAHGRTSGVLLDDFEPNSVRYRGSLTGREAAGSGAVAGGGSGRGGWRPPLILAILFSPFTIVYKVITSGLNLLIDLWRGPPPPTRPSRPPVAAAQRREQQARQSLRQEQESAYEKSLRADREKARLRKEAESEKAREEQLARDREQWRRWRASTLIPEPGAEVKQVSRLSIRMADGERVIRKFPAGASIDEIYAFVECHGLEPNEKVPSKPEGYTHSYAFRLVQAMPRAVYEAESGSVGSIGRSANLIVEAVEESDDE